MAGSDNSQASATMSSKGQVVIPSAIRRRLNLVQGSVVRFLVEGDSVRLLAEAGDVRRLKGRLAPPPRTVSIGTMNAAVAARRAGTAAKNAIAVAHPARTRHDRP